MAKKRKSAKRRKASPAKRRTYKARKPMARKATKRRKASKPAPRRRSSGGRSFGPRGLMSILTPIALGAAGYIVADMAANELLASKSPNTRAAAKLGAGAALALLMPSLAPAAVGMGVNGAVDLGRNLLKLGAPGSIQGLSAAERERIRRIAGRGTAMVNGMDAGMVNGADRGMVNGLDRGMVNGVRGFASIDGNTNTGDRAYI